MKKRLVVVGNGEITENLSSVVDTADEVIRFQGCYNYYSNLTGQKTTQLILRDIFDPHTVRGINPHENKHIRDLFLYRWTIPPEVLKQIKKWIIVISGAFIYEKPRYYDKHHYLTGWDEGVEKYYKRSPNDQKKYYDILRENINVYYDRYPKLQKIPVQFIHQHDAIQTYRQNNYAVLIPSSGFIYLYYLVYYSEYVFNYDIELVGFAWKFAGHHLDSEKKYVQKWLDEKLISKIHKGTTNE